MNEEDKLWATDEIDGQIVVYPMDDIAVHDILNDTCRCGARRTKEGILVHDAFDGRQIIERAEDGIPQII